MQRFFNYREGEIMYSNVYKGIHLTFEEQINLLNLKFKFKK